MCVNESFCVTGSDDGYLRIWPLDFKQVLLEAQHDGPVTGVDISNDCMRVLASTSTVCCEISLSYEFISCEMKA
jgi:WD40 repeat protein